MTSTVCRDCTVRQPTVDRHRVVSSDRERERVIAVNVAKPSDSR